MTIKLIATDMDDTLLNSKIEISERNQKALAAAKEAGMLVLFATGRMFVSAQAFAQRLNMDVPLVTYNGGLVKGSLSNEVFYEKKLKLSTALTILEYCRAKKHYVQMYCDDVMYIHTANEFSAKYAAIARIEAVPIGDAIYTPKEAPNKLLIMTPSEDFEATWKEIEQQFGEVVDVTSSKTNFLEIMEPGVNKWEAIKKVAAMYNIKPEETMCFGDSNNDVEMIKQAGVGVAVGNAKPEVQQVAKIITASNNEDGVAMVLEQLLTKQITPAL